MPGAYAEVHFKLPTDAAHLPPAGEHADLPHGRPARGDRKNGTVALIPITLGRDFGNTVEVVSGLTGAELVVVNPPDSLTDGQAVTVGREPRCEIRRDPQMRFDSADGQSRNP